MTTQAVTFNAGAVKMPSKVNTKQTDIIDVASTDSTQSFNDVMDSKAADTTSADDTQLSVKDNDKVVDDSGDNKLDCKIVQNNIKTEDSMLDDRNLQDINLLNISIIDGKLAVTVEGANVDEAVMTQLESAIKSFICDALGIDEEEFERVIQESGLTTMNILQMDGLKQFFVEANDMQSFTDILTDGELSNMWNNLLESISQFVTYAEDGAVIVDPVALNQYLEEHGLIEDNFENVINLKPQDAKSTEDDINNSIVPEEDILETNNSKVEVNITDDSVKRDSTPEREVHENDTRETPDETLFDKFVSNVEKAAVKTNEFTVEQVRQIRQIATQVIEAIKVNVKPETTGFEIQLNPEHLGKVNVVIEMKEGIATANFIVRNEMARVALENQMQELKTTFENQGLKVEAVEVTVSNFEFDQNRQAASEENGGGQLNRRRSFNDAVSEETEEIEEVAEDLSEGGINLTA